MKASQFHISTLREAPADAEVVSHRLMTRAGMIKKLGAGIYTLSVAVVDDSMLPVVRLAIMGRETDGWYPLHDVEVSKR